MLWCLWVSQYLFLCSHLKRHKVRCKSTSIPDSTNSFSSCNIKTNIPWQKANPAPYGGVFTSNRQCQFEVYIRIGRWVTANLLRSFTNSEHLRSPRRGKVIQCEAQILCQNILWIITQSGKFPNLMISCFLWSRFRLFAIVFYRFRLCFLNGCPPVFCDTLSDVGSCELYLGAEWQRVRTDIVDSRWSLPYNMQEGFQT